MQELFEFLATPVGVIAGLIVIIGGALSTFKWGRGLVRSIVHSVTLYKPTVPRETLRLVLQPHQTRWSMGSVTNKPAMHIVSHWYATNITNAPIRLTRAYLVKPKTEGHMLVRAPYRDMYGRYAIEPRATSEVLADFWIVPPIRQEGQDFIGTVVIVDQFGNEHRAKGVVFSAPRVKGS